MKKINLILMTLLIALPMMVLQSCDDDGYSLNNFVVGMATVRVNGGSYYLEADNGRTLFPAASQIYYRPVDGQRVVAEYTLLYDNYYGYDHGVRVNYIYNVLTKKVEELTEENEEEIGNDPTLIHDWWLGGNYLNVKFWMYLPQTHKHRVSLVRNTLEEAPEDDYIHLEFRYNDFDDVTPYERLGIVSFNLKEYFSEEVLGEYLGIKIKYNDRNEGEKFATIVFPTATPLTQEISSEDLYDFSTEGKVE